VIAAALLGTLVSAMLTLQSIPIWERFVTWLVFALVMIASAGR
jgi:hypothetical protein